MSIKSEFSRELETYFSGEMTGTDRLVFEAKVESDPMFKAEFESQQDIIESLKSHRASELKKRLNDISVEPTLIGALLQSSWVKPIIYGVASLSVITGTYLFYNTTEAVNYHLERVDSKREYFTASRINLDFNDEIDFTYHPEKVKAIKSVSNSISHNKNQVSISTKPSVKSEQLSFDVPDMSLEEEEEFRAPGLSIALTEKVETVSVISAPEKISINKVNSRRYNFHYRIEDNRLFLYGKFDQSPYEILEVNTPSDKRIYFYYDGEFFHLKKGARDITKLSKIEDQNLIEKLGSIKSNYRH